DGEKLVHALHHAIDVIHTAGIGARAHGNNPTWLHQLLVQSLNNRRHLDKHRSSDHHEICLAGCATNHLRTEARDIKLTCNAGGHLHVTTGQSEIEGPQGVLTPPCDQILQPRKDDAAAYGLFEWLVVWMSHQS